MSWGGERRGDDGRREKRRHPGHEVERREERIRGEEKQRMGAILVQSWGKREEERGKEKREKDKRRRGGEKRRHPGPEPLAATQEPSRSALLSPALFTIPATAPN